MVARETGSAAGPVCGVVEVEVLVGKSVYMATLAAFWDQQVANP